MAFLCGASVLHLLGYMPEKVAHPGSSYGLGRKVVAAKVTMTAAVILH